MVQEARACAIRIGVENSASGLPAGVDTWKRVLEQKIAQGHEVASMTPEACPRIMLCIPTFKRTWQLLQTLPINLTLAWELRNFVTFVVADLNHELEDDMQLLLEKVQAARQVQFLRYFRRRVPEEDGWTHWHASVGKNCAHICAIKLEPKSIVVELDNAQVFMPCVCAHCACRVSKGYSRAKNLSNKNSGV